MTLPTFYTERGAITFEGERAVNKWLNNEILARQGLLVDTLLKNEIASYDDIDNAYTTCPDTGELEPQEIMEWYLVTGWFANQLRAEGEPILDYEGNQWWGRCCSGQWVGADYVITKLAAEHNIADFTRH